MTTEPDIDNLFDNHNVISIPRRMNNIENASDEFITARKEADRLLDTLEYYIYNSRKYLNYNKTNHHRVIDGLLTRIQPICFALDDLIPVLQEHNPIQD